MRARQGEESARWAGPYELRAHTPCLLQASELTCALLSLCTYTGTQPNMPMGTSQPAFLKYTYTLRAHNLHVFTHPVSLPSPSAHTCRWAHRSPSSMCAHKHPWPQNQTFFCPCAHTSASTPMCTGTQLAPFLSVHLHMRTHRHPPALIHVCILIGAHIRGSFPTCAYTLIRFPCAHKCIHTLPPVRTNAHAIWAPVLLVRTGAHIPGPCPPCAHTCTPHWLLTPARATPHPGASPWVSISAPRAHTHAHAQPIPLRAKRGPPGGRRRRRAPKARKRAQARCGSRADAHVTAPRTSRRPTPARQGEPRARRLAGQDPGPECAPGPPACPCPRVRARVSVSAPSCLSPRVRALTVSQVRRAGGRRGPGSREGRGHAGCPQVPVPLPRRVCAPLRVLPPPAPSPGRHRRGFPGDPAVGSGGPGSPAGPAGGLLAEQQRRRLHPAGIGVGPGAQGLGVRGAWGRR